MNSLAIKSILGLLNLSIIMGLALFVPAGTIHYRLAWWYLIIFLGGTLFISGYIYVNDKRLLQSRLKVGSVAEKRKLQKLIQTIAGVGFIGIYVIAGFDYRFHWSNMPFVISIISDGFIILTMVFFFAVFKMNTYLSATIEIQKDQQVVERGPYAIVRHPMYSTALLLFVFTPLALGSYWALTALPLMIAVLVLRAIDEENALKKELTGYTEYCKKVKYRLIPFLF